MPSKLKQLNIRLTEEDERLIEELLPKARESTGLDVSQSELVRLALRALKREYAGKVKGGRK
jgi:Arc/MetJ-type ribon-helix-helix transcriptional regulator